MKKGFKIELITEISNFIYSFKNKIVEANEIALKYEEQIVSFANQLRELELNKEFEEIGQKMIDSWKLSLSQKTHKELAIETIRNWTAN